MTRKTLLTLALALTATGARALDKFDQHFQDVTLRLDYHFTGDNVEQMIFLKGMQQTPGWYGRRVNMDRLQLLGNGQLTVTDTLGRDTLYRHAFSSLFQEWQSTEEATQRRMSFENVLLMPMPKEPVTVTVTLTDTHNRVTSQLTHRVDPHDILITRNLGQAAVTPWRYVWQGGDSRDCIDIALVAEGYTAEQTDLFYEDCQRAVDAISGHEPFRSGMRHFNFVGVACPSAEAGVSIPNKGVWRNTAMGSHYDTFYSQRYLTVPNIFRMHDLLAGIPYEHIIVLANTENYGGGGIFNSYLISSAHHATMAPVVVHEFGHSFGGLGDEYFYDDQYEPMYPTDTEPWEPNLTTLVDFGSKWADMLPEGTPIPTQPDGKDIYRKVGVYEGGGYQSKGVYRPVQECRMKINEAPEFCPVCERAIRRLIRYYTEEAE